MGCCSATGLTFSRTAGCWLLTFCWFWGVTQPLSMWDAASLQDAACSWAGLSPLLEGLPTPFWSPGRPGKRRRGACCCTWDPPLPAVSSCMLTVLCAGGPMSLCVSLEGVVDRKEAAPEAWLSSVTCACIDSIFLVCLQLIR